MSDNNKKDLSIIGLIVGGCVLVGEAINKGLDARARKKAMKLALYETNKEGDADE